LSRKGPNWLSGGIPEIGGDPVTQKMAAPTKIKIKFIIYNYIEKKQRVTRIAERFRFLPLRHWTMWEDREHAGMNVNTSRILDGIPVTLNNEVIADPDVWRFNLELLSRQPFTHISGFRNKKRKEEILIHKYQNSSPISNTSHIWASFVNITYLDLTLLELDM